MNLLSLTSKIKYQEELGETEEDLNSNIKASAKTLAILRIWVEGELSKLDNELKFSKLRESTDRGELALMAGVQRAKLLELLELLKVE